MGDRRSGKDRRGGGGTDRRYSGLLRVPFVRLCSLAFDDGKTADAFIVNINVLGAYLARDEMPTLGQNVSCRFTMPGSERPIAVRGVVVWLNPRQQHPVHSLPPGFGLKFADLTSDDRERIERVVEEYVGGLPQG